MIHGSLYVNFLCRYFTKTALKKEKNQIVSQIVIPRFSPPLDAKSIYLIFILSLTFPIGHFLAFF